MAADYKLDVCSFYMREKAILTDSAGQTKEWHIEDMGYDAAQKSIREHIVNSADLYAKTIIDLYRAVRRVTVNPEEDES